MKNVEKGRTGKAPKKKRPLTAEEKASRRKKRRVAAQLGLSEKLREVGWGGLTARETGQIGGLISSRSRRKGS